MLHKILSMNRLLNEAHTDEKERTKRRQLQTYSKRSLGSGLNRRLVALPPGEDRDAWLAANTMDFYEAVSLMSAFKENVVRPSTYQHILEMQVSSLVGIAADESSSKQLPGWGFPPGYEYLWIGEGLRRPVKCSGELFESFAISIYEKKKGTTAHFLKSCLDFLEDLLEEYQTLKITFIYSRRRVHWKRNELGGEGPERPRYFSYLGVCGSISSGVPKNLQAHLQTLIPRFRNSIYAALPYNGEPRGKNHRKIFMHLTLISSLRIKSKVECHSWWTRI